MGGKRIKWTDDKIQFIIEKYTNQEMNTYELPKYFGCSNDTIGRRLKENNIALHRFYEDLTGKKIGKLTVLQKSEKSNRRLYWDCLCECGKIVTIKGDHLRQNNQLSCGCLNSLGEHMIAQLLKENNVMFITQYKFEDFVADHNNIPYRFDFAIFEDNKLSYLIEFDGEQHFYYNKTSSSWNSKENFEKTIERDKKKTDYCLKNNIPLIRIPYYKKQNLTIEDLKLQTTQFLMKEG